MMLLLRILAYPKAKIQIRTHRVKKYSFNYLEAISYSSIKYYISKIES